MIINGTFQRNSATSLGSDTNCCYGGALYCQSGCTVIIHNSTFNNNTAIRDEELDKNKEANHGAGGAIAIVEGAKVVISASKFNNNEAVGDGGAIYVWNSTIHKQM